MECGGKFCLFIIFGIGVGGGVDYFLILVKKVFLRKVGERNLDERIVEFEEELFIEVNFFGVGFMGMGGKIIIFDVKIEIVYRYFVSFLVGLVV